jgi:excinuclease ABC subunit A
MTSGEAGGKVVAEGPPAEVAKVTDSRTAPYLSPFL